MAKKSSKETGFSKEERDAMKARAKELAAEQRANKKKADGEKDVMEVIEAMAENDKNMARKLHALVTQTAPALWPRTWYGMPAYAMDGKIVCFFQSSGKFGTRYSTLGFNDTAKLDDGSMWPTAFALAGLGPKEEKRIIELVTKAVC
ncbi:MAG: hypothetical protein H6728_14300 [Myxococcales bacterium]|nr:hypothetical protein [Myxococcales bacterium]MCB9644244.1 hypothetical protein [Myxococcales bacterium]